MCSASSTTYNSFGSNAASNAFSLKNLEEDLGLTLFERTKNKLTLNQNGEYVLELAKKLLEDADSLTEKAREFDRKNHTIFLGTCAPAPLWTLTPMITGLFPHMALQADTTSDKRLFRGLDQNHYQLIVTHEKPDSDSYFFKEWGTESLMFALPKDHKYANKKSLSFSDMNGENMLLMPDIGFWSFVLEKMPDSRFLTQNNRYSFQELVQASSLPCFVTDVSENYRVTAENRIAIPISALPDVLIKTAGGSVNCNLSVCK
ncbi:LysR family transcriptional regulator [Clostridium sp. OM02-18AC]|uniref:LysR family transcriptional regulator n=1 Tax=Clostridium sp. OM02-18AC TaxID=2292311 RepID=UPI000E4AD935|nr:LysR family transcriptional regulator [Clostridium sp. OM02-18AC]RHV63834.1 LysR family transcriptional regulator [Clostridium sp. OM02-18AC]